MTFELIITTFMYFFHPNFHRSKGLLHKKKKEDISQKLRSVTTSIHDFNIILSTNKVVISQDPSSILCKNTIMFVYMFRQFWCMSCFIGSSEKGTFFSDDTFLDSSPKVHPTVLFSAL